MKLHLAWGSPLQRLAASMVLVCDKFAQQHYKHNQDRLRYAPMVLVCDKFAQQRYNYNHRLGYVFWNKYPDGRYSTRSPTSIVLKNATGRRSRDHTKPSASDLDHLFLLVRFLRVRFQLESVRPEISLVCVVVICVALLISTAFYLMNIYHL